MITLMIVLLIVGLVAISAGFFVGNTTDQNYAVVSVFLLVVGFIALIIDVIAFVIYYIVEKFA